jgi:hypothetical protein
MTRSRKLSTLFLLNATALAGVAIASAPALASPPDVPPGLEKKNPPGIPPGQAAQSIQIDMMGGRPFGGTTIPMPTDPGNFQACDHGFTEWFIPPGKRKHPMILVHGSSIKGYETTFDGQPGFQTIFLRDHYPVYLVDLPWTGRAGKACSTYTWNPVNNGFSARFVFQNRVGLWPSGTPASSMQFFPGVAFSHDPKVLDIYFRNQYVENNAAANVTVESAALAVLIDEVYQENGRGGILHTHSSSANRGLTAARLSDKLGGEIYWEPSAAPVFAEGELPPPIPRADGVQVPAGTTIPLTEFLKYTKFPILIIWGDNIPKTLDPINVGDRLVLDSRRVLTVQWQSFAEAVNNHGGNAVVIHLPDVGVFGNTHYPMSDTNITQVSAVVSLWLKNQGLDK